MNPGDLIKKVQNISNLPTLPAIVMELNRTLQDYESPVENLLDLLEKDQSLVLKILRLVNSSFFGFKNKVSSLRHAVTLLGYSTIQSAVVAVAVIDTLSMKKKLNGFEIERFWEHSIHVAVLSKYVAANTRIAPAENAFTAGLLHDIGKVILAHFFPDIFVQVAEFMQSESVPFSEAEKALELPSHGLIGSILAQRWMLPDVLVGAIRHHHDGAGRSPEPQLTALIGVGNTIVHKIAGDNPYPLSLSHFPEEQKNSMAAFLNNGCNWYREIKKEIQEASLFFKKG